MSSSYGAGVPIKKRRFPIIRPPSPTSEEQSSELLGNESVQKEESRQSQWSVISNASTPASSSTLSDAIKDSIHEKVEGNIDGTSAKMISSVGVKIEGTSPTTLQPASRADVDSNEKIVATQRTAKVELNLSPTGPPVFNARKEVYSEQKVDRKSDTELSNFFGNTELSLGINDDHLFTSANGQNCKSSCQIKENEEPVVLNMSPSKGESINRRKSNAFELNTGGANMCTNRSIWDLNTTADAWDGSVVDQVSDQNVAGRFNSITGTHDVKPLISSIGMVGGSVSSGKQIPERNETQLSVAALPDLSSHHCDSEDRLNLGLSPPCLLSNLNNKPYDSPAVLNSGANLSSSTFVPSGNLGKINNNIVKSEPHDESTSHDLKGAVGIPEELLHFRAVKSELAERCNPEAMKSSTISTLKLIDPRSIKREPIHGSMQETPKQIEETSKHPGKMMLSGQDTIGKSTISAYLSVSRGDVPNSSGHPSSNERSQCGEEAPQKKAETSKLLATDIMSASVEHDDNEAIVPGTVDSTMTGDKVIDGREECILKIVDASSAPPNSMGNGMESGSDEEKINLSGDMLEEDSYDLDYESYENHDLAAMDTEPDKIREEDFEDGEVRDPLANTAIDSVCEKRGVEPFDNDDFHKEKMCFVGLSNKDIPEPSYVENKVSKIELVGETNYNIMNAETATDGKKTNDGAADRDTILQEPFTVEMPTNEAANCPKREEKAHSFDQAPDTSQGNSKNVVQGWLEDVKNTDVIDTNISDLPKSGTPMQLDDAAKAANTGGQKSRIINLRASIPSSPGETRTLSARYMPLRAGRVPDVVIGGDRLCPRGRGEIYSGDFHKFLRGRPQDQASRNSRFNFVRGRGRISSRIDSRSGYWDSERDFAPEVYNGQPECRVPRRKYASQNDIEFSSYNGGLSATFAGTDRGGRKLLNDETPVFRPPPLRRQSPRGRGGPPVCGLDMDMDRRIPRNASPGRCIGEGSAEFVGLRHNEEFMRSFPPDNSNPTYTHPRSSFEGMGSQFVRGNRNLPMQRRGVSRVCSKSQIASRNHAHGTWSPRRRSPDGFGGTSEFSNRRSPPVFRMERMRSPDDSCFSTEMIGRRHGSPYTSRQTNEFRDMGSSRNLGHPRSVIPDRSPGRLFFRNNRRVDMVDSRERTSNDDFFGKPMHTAKCQELGADGTNEERRSSSERRGPVRPFRHPFNGADGDNFHNAENGPRPFRFHPQNDSDFYSRGNPREREFDRKIKNPPRNAPTRMRNIEEQEGNFRHPRHVWHDEGFEDTTRLKRKRF